MDIKTEFEEFLASKSIDAKAFAEGNPEKFESFLRLFGKVSPKSFVQQKLFLINKTRRTYHLPKPEKSATPPQTTNQPKPKIKLKLKPKKTDDSNPTATPPPTQE